MQGLKDWASGVIIAVVIATILEMVIPENKNKKYIKTVIGIYILFTIISPILSHAITDGKLDISKYETFFNTIEEYNTLSSEFEQSHANNIEAMYKAQLKEDIKNKLKAKGFGVQAIDLNIITAEGETYGTIEEIKLTVSKIQENTEQEENTTKNEISISKIEIGNTIKEEKNTIQEMVTEKQKEEIKTYLQAEYGTKKEHITIQ